MYEFKSIIRVLWPTLFCIVLMITGAVSIYYAVTTSVVTHEQKMNSSPCIDFNSKPIQEVPARCFQYFTEHK